MAELAAAESRHAEKVGRLHSVVVSILDELVVAVADLMFAAAPLPARQECDDATYVIGILATRTFNALRSAEVLIVAGYYLPAVTLIRSAFEDWVTSVYVNEHPSEAGRWLDQDQPREPSLTAMLDGIQRSTAARGFNFQAVAFGSNGIYGDLSSLAHPRSESVAAQILPGVDRNTARLGPIFDPTVLRSVCANLVWQLDRQLDLVHVLAARLEAQVPDGLLEQAQRAHERAVAWLRRESEAISSDEG